MNESALPPIITGAQIAVRTPASMMLTACRRIGSAVSVATSPCAAARTSDRLTGNPWLIHAPRPPPRGSLPRPARPPDAGRYRLNPVPSATALADDQPPRRVRPPHFVQSRGEVHADQPQLPLGTAEQLLGLDRVDTPLGLGHPLRHARRGHRRAGQALADLHPKREPRDTQDVVDPASCPGRA